MSVHIEGMGIPGSLLALLLDELGIPFSWHDTDEQRVAWQASTGAIYPANSQKFGDDWKCWETWKKWIEDRKPVYRFTEKANYIFNHKSAPPHGGKYPVFDPTVHGLRMASPCSMHLNAQKMVPSVRKRFASRRLPGKPLRSDAYIVTHGFSWRLSHVYWGWTRRVTLEYPEIYGCQNRRPCFYFREGRFIMAYAYPIPKTPYWYAGSSIIRQPADRRKSLSVEDKYERWKRNFERLGNGAVKVVEEQDFIEGWRPAAKDSKTWLETEDNVIYLRPLWNSGIRHFPQQWEELLALPILQKLVKHYGH